MKVHYWRAFDTLKECYLFISKEQMAYDPRGYDTTLRIVYPAQDGEPYVVAGWRYASCD